MGEQPMGYPLNLLYPKAEDYSEPPLALRGFANPFDA
jgi:hypothetical protein